MPAATGRLIAIGDVHGCIHALDAVLGEMQPTPADTLVFLGDLIDCGRNTKEVLDRVIELQRACQVVLIQGNHEEMMQWAKSDAKALDYWQNHGGAPMLSSYKFPGKIDDILPEHWRLIDQCLPYYETDDFIFTHANYQHDLPMAEQDGRTLRWALFEPQEARRHISGKPVLVGHTEQREGEVLDLGFAMCIDTACWRYGWLTAIEPATGESWQASKWGVAREKGEETHRERLTVLLQSGG